jgi:hypothetical protein
MDALYHYCPTQTFHSIVQSRAIWLSSLTLSNDSMEGKLVARAIARIAEREGLDSGAVERLEKAITFLEGMFDGLGFCLSEEGDLLSQWRGYAADASGVAIGFSRSYLQSLAALKRENGTPGFSLDQVEYSTSGHETQVEPTYFKMKKLLEAGAFKPVFRTLLDIRSDEELEAEEKRINQASRDILLTALELFPKLFFLKAPAFAEEREWRLVSILVRDLTDDRLYRAIADRVIPYRKYELVRTDISPIVDVVLGPKHQTPPNVVGDFLKRNGFGEVQVRRSSATYR